MPQSCPHCNATNRDTAQFCAQCSRPLRQTCVNCGADNPSRSRFCNKCGTALDQSPYCSNCGQVNPAGSLFCNGCGAVLSPAGQVSPASAPLAYAVTGQLAPQSKLAGRYVIHRRIGRGGMGAVYQVGDDRITGKTWAIKEMSGAAITDPLEKRQAVDAFRQEAVMLATLDHPNLPKVTDHFSEGGKQYLVMDFIEGETLEERVDRGGGKPLPVDEVLRWADQLCDVLTYLHNRQPPVIFRDLKPDNVMVTPEGTVKLIDFGIARLFKPGKVADTAFFGTMGYSPREQYGRGQTDARSDVYALGATLYHLLTGDDPTDHPFEFESAHLLNVQVPVHMSDAIAKALADDPADRWQSVAEMRQALKERPAVEPKPVLESKPAPTRGPQPQVSAALQPAAASVRAAAVSAAQPVSTPIASRLNFWNGVGLTVLGVVLFAVGGFTASLFGEVASRVLWIAFIPALFGILFGPWVGGFTSLAGWLAFFLLMRRFPLLLEVGPIVAIAGFAMGAVPAWLVKDTRNRTAAVGAGFVASLLWTFVFFIGTGIAWREWPLIWERALHELTMVLPANVTLLPFFAHRLVKGGNWKAVIGSGIAASLLWAVLAGLGEGLLLSVLSGDWIALWSWVRFGRNLLAVLPVVVLLAPLVAFWLAGSVRRWRLYWRDDH
jgi:serine/threonine-protein kinase